MNVAIVKYNAGNTASVVNALERLGVNAIITDREQELRSADKVIFPGVGEASTAMAYLSARGLDKIIPTLVQPVLGICLGMQLLCTYSQENDTQCLGILPQRVNRIIATGLRVPHVGWNTINSLSGRLFDGIAEGSYVYFVHGFSVEPGNPTTAVTRHGEVFSSAVERDNFYAVQFHPERSGTIGEKILENFLRI